MQFVLEDKIWGEQQLTELHTALQTLLPGYTVRWEDPRTILIDLAAPMTLPKDPVVHIHFAPNQPEMHVSVEVDGIRDWMTRPYMSLDCLRSPRRLAQHIAEDFMPVATAFIARECDRLKAVLLYQECQRNAFARLTRLADAQPAKDATPVSLGWDDGIVTFAGNFLVHTPGGGIYLQTGKLDEETARKLIAVLNEANQPVAT